MELAEKGNNLNVDMTNEDATASKASESKGEQSVYSAIHDMDPRPVFLWGQAVGKNLCKLTWTPDLYPSGVGLQAENGFLFSELLACILC